MVSALAIDARGPDEEGVDVARGGGVEDELVGLAVGGVGGVDLADVGWVGVVEGVGLRDVVACVAAVDEVAGAAEVDEDGFLGGGGATGDAAEDGGADVGLEGGGCVDDDGVGCAEGGEDGGVGEGAVDDGDFAEVVEGAVEVGGAEEGGYGDVGVFFAEDFEEGSCFECLVLSLLCGIMVRCANAYLLLVRKRPGTTLMPCSLPSIRMLSLGEFRDAKQLRSEIRVWVVGIDYPYLYM